MKDESTPHACIVGPSQLIKINDGQSVHVRTAAEWLALARRDLKAARSEIAFPDMNESGWTPEQALRFYAGGKHFDVVEGRTRILDTGAVASDALKGLSAEYAAGKGTALSATRENDPVKLLAATLDAADAARYRWLRSQEVSTDPRFYAFWHEFTAKLCREGKMDALIDKAMQEYEEHAENINRIHP